MFQLQHLPIRKKVNIAILSTSIFALTSAGLTIIGYELTSFRKTAFVDLKAMAEIVGANSAGALVFQDAAAADHILSQLKGRTSVSCARIFTKDGHPFATFVEDGVKKIPERPEGDRSFIGWKTLELFHPIEYRGDRIGTIYLESKLDVGYARLRRYALIVCLMILLLIPLVYLVSWLFQRAISRPIIKLADIARKIAEWKDYSLRAPVTGTDEVGQLTRTFNHMLETIEERDRKLMRQAEDLWRSNKELEQFAYVSSHDLQEPLRKITTYSQLLESRHKSGADTETSKYIANICTSAVRMRTLIQDLLAYSRLNREEPLTKEVDLKSILKQVLNDFEVQISEKKVLLSFDELPVIHGNPSQLHQLFQNLISNAIKFHGEGPIKVHISSKLENGVFKIGVHDNGIGIDAKYHDQIFKVFQRLHGQEKYPGTGIGLAICKKIVEQHGGKIWLDSTLGEGTTFYFTLPQAKAHAA